MREKGWLFGIFSDPALAADAVRQLQRAGVTEDDIQWASGVPFPEEAFRAHKPSVSLQWLTLLGGLLGAAAGFALGGGTAILHKIPTGHMNLVALPPVGIITYEMMMLGATLFTLVGLVFFMRKGRRRVDEPRLGDGYVVVMTPLIPDGDSASTEAILRESGAETVRIDNVNDA